MVQNLYHTLLFLAMMRLSFKKTEEARKPGKPLIDSLPLRDSHVIRVSSRRWFLPISPIKRLLVPQRASQALAKSTGPGVILL